MHALADTGTKNKALKVGAITGALLSFTIIMMMDFMVADTMQGSWRDAIVHDLKHYFSITVSADSLIAYLLYLLVIIAMALIGALFGMLFVFIIHKYLSLLSS